MKIKTITTKIKRWFGGLISSDVSKHAPSSSQKPQRRYPKVPVGRLNADQISPEEITLTLSPAPEMDAETETLFLDNIEDDGWGAYRTEMPEAELDFDDLIPWIEMRDRLLDGSAYEGLRWSDQIYSNTDRHAHSVEEDNPNEEKEYAMRIINRLVSNDEGDTVEVSQTYDENISADTLTAAWTTPIEIVGYSEVNSSEKAKI